MTVVPRRNVDLIYIWLFWHMGVMFMVIVTSQRSLNYREFIITFLVWLIIYSQEDEGVENLTDGDLETYWESDGHQGQHWIRLKMKKGTILK